jgi:HSP20 family molecular chaperone IbpA
VSRELDTTKSDAAFKGGLLKVRIPKAEAAKKRTIDIKVR